jgi:hypothetical protein
VADFIGANIWYEEQQMAGALFNFLDIKLLFVF